jgi:hypothetical protein
MMNKSNQLPARQNLGNHSGGGLAMEWRRNVPVEKEWRLSGLCDGREILSSSGHELPEIRQAVLVTHLYQFEREREREVKSSLHKYELFLGGQDPSLPHYSSLFHHLHIHLFVAMLWQKGE